MIGTKAAIIGFGVSTVASFGAGVGANVLQRHLEVKLLIGMRHGKMELILLFKVQYVSG